MLKCLQPHRRETAACLNLTVRWFKIKHVAWLSSKNYNQDKNSTHQLPQSERTFQINTPTSMDHSFKHAVIKYLKIKVACFCMLAFVPLVLTLLLSHVSAAAMNRQSSANPPQVEIQPSPSWRFLPLDFPKQQKHSADVGSDSCHHFKLENI